MPAFEKRFLVCCGAVLFFLDSVPGFLAGVCFRSGFRHVSDMFQIACLKCRRGAHRGFVCVFVVAEVAFYRNGKLTVSDMNSCRRPCFRSAVAPRVSGGVSDAVSDGVSDSCFRSCFRYLKHSGFRGSRKKSHPYRYAQAHSGKQ